MGEFAAGTLFAGHRIEEVAGRGGMGVVYRARNEITEREVALKVLAPHLTSDARFRERFKRESRLAARLEHPNVIPLFHAGEEAGALYLVMRYVVGTDLGAQLARGGGLELGRALHLVEQVAAALDAAHRQGLVHRDVKPANVLIEGEPPNERAYLTDFGLVKDLASESSLTDTGTFMGTYLYAAPEQFDPKRFGAIGPRTDVYALGCVLFHTLTGEVPFPRETTGALVGAHMFDDPPDIHAARPELPPALSGVVRRALAKRSEERWESAGDLARAARATVAPPPTAPVAPAPPPAATVPEPPRTDWRVVPPPVAKESQGAGGPWWRSRAAIIAIVAGLLILAGVAGAAGAGVFGGGGDDSGGDDSPPAPSYSDEPYSDSYSDSYSNPYSEPYSDSYSDPYYPP